MTNTAASAKLDLSSLLDPTPPRRPSRQRHRINWFIHDSVEFELECLHEPMQRPYICDGEMAKEDPYIFPEMHEGDREPLRDGVIESWWGGSGEDSEMWWRYVKEDEPATKP